METNVILFRNDLEKMGDKIVYNLVYPIRFFRKIQEGVPLDCTLEGVRYKASELIKEEPSPCAAETPEMWVIAMRNMERMTLEESEYNLSVLKSLI